MATEGARTARISTEESRDSAGLSGAPESEIRSRITGRGKIPFAEFMELALYAPGTGYYTRPSGRGATGDYYTSPAAHPIFGALLAIQFQSMWQALDRPHRFHVVEMGAGNGLLARDVVDYAGKLEPKFAASLFYTAIDRRHSVGCPPRMPDNEERITAAGIPLRGVVGCFLSNELVDAFPVHRFQIQGGQIEEIYVTLDEQGGFTDVAGEPSTPLLSRAISGLRPSLGDRFRGEVNLNIKSWNRAMSDALERGFVLTIDYGSCSEELYAPDRVAGTLQTYFQHTEGASPYVRIGRQDITAHVDFSAIAAAGRSVGLNSLGLRTQRQFLADLGFGAMMENLRVMGLSQRDRNANMMAMLDLVKPDGLGDFKVLLQERGTGVEGLEPVTPRTPSAGEASVPLKRREHLPLMEGRYPHLAWDYGDLWPGEGAMQDPGPLPS